VKRKPLRSLKREKAQPAIGRGPSNNETALKNKTGFEVAFLLFDNWGKKGIH
jgi:hypothetical protein